MIAEPKLSPRAPPLSGKEVEQILDRLPKGALRSKLQSTALLSQEQAEGLNRVDQGAEE